MIGQSKNGVIVESLLDGKRIPAYSNQQISSLEEISIYGEVEDIPLKDIFARIFKMENGGQTSVPPKSSGADLRDYFSDVVPEHDQERVYSSDIKKVLTWYNLLLSKGLVDDVVESPEEDNSEAPAEEEA